MQTETHHNPSHAPEKIVVTPQGLGRLLLVEDHDVNRLLIKAMTERLGYTTELADDGADAVAKIDAAFSDGQPFDLVLMDVQMPYMDGYEATRMVRASGIAAETLPIIAISANAYKEDIDSCRAAGMQGHIAKPILFDNLHKTLAEWAPTQAVEAVEPPDAVETVTKISVSDDLNDRYQARKDQALCSLASLVRMNSFTDGELTECSDHLHKLAGTAAMFGESRLGDIARELENGIAEWTRAERPDNIRDAVAELLKVGHMDRAA